MFSWKKLSEMTNKLVSSRRHFISGSAAFLSAPAIARAAGTSVAPYIGPVATGCALADACTATTSPTIQNSYTQNVCVATVTSTVANAVSSLSRTPCVMMDAPSTIQIVVPTWYVGVPQGSNSCVATNEISQPGSTAIAVAIEWANGAPLAPVTFQGGRQIPVSQGGGVSFVSDPVPNQASIGQRFWVWIAQVNENGIIYRSRTPGLGDSPNGEAWLYNFTPDVLNSIVTNNGLSGLSYANFSSYGTLLNGLYNPCTFRPAAILGLTTKPTVALIGDSRAAGLGDNYLDGAGFIGNMERSIGPHFAYLQLSRVGESATNFDASGTKRMQLAGMCSHVIENLGGNDILAGYAFDPTLTLYKRILWNQFGKPLNRIFSMTIDPVTNSSDLWTTTQNQTPETFSSQCTQYNSFIRRLSNGITPIDTASTVEPSWSGTEDFRWSNSSYAVTAFTQSTSGTEAVANLASAAGLSVGCCVKVSAFGGGTGVYAIDAINGGSVQLYLSNFAGQNWSAGGTLNASLCASHPNYGLADGIHANPIGYRRIAQSGVIPSGLFQF
jgi:hypothetical protein